MCSLVLPGSVVQFGETQCVHARNGYKSILFTHDFMAESNAMKQVVDAVLPAAYQANNLHSEELPRVFLLLRNQLFESSSSTVSNPILYTGFNRRCILYSCTQHARPMSPRAFSIIRALLFQQTAPLPFLFVESRLLDRPICPATRCTA